MIAFHSPKPEEKEQYDRLRALSGKEGCEYNFVNLYLWGRQKIAFIGDCVAFFSQFKRQSVYLFPIGTGDKKPVLDAIIQDAAKRGIPCRFTGLNEEDCQLLQTLYPDRFCCHSDRDSFDYVYDINDLATLAGKKFQKKRNHLNRFRQNNPDATAEPITAENCHRAESLAETWYRLRLEADPHADFQLEQAALSRAFRHREELGLDGLILSCDGQDVAFTLGSRLNESTFDIHFEKALDLADGAYPAINNLFANYLREKYPELAFLNREDDMGLEGLRKAKLSYNPHHLVEKRWVHLKEDGYDY